MTHDTEAVDVTERQEPQAHPVRFPLRISCCVLDRRHLQYICDDIIMRDHNAFLHSHHISTPYASPHSTSPDSQGASPKTSAQNLQTHRQTRRPAREANKRSLARALAPRPLELRQLRQLRALGDEVGHAGEAGDGLKPVGGRVDDEDAVAGQADGRGGGEGGVEERRRRGGEEDARVRDLQLVLELLLVVGCAGGRGYAVEALDGVADGDVVDLGGRGC